MGGRDGPKREFSPKGEVPSVVLLIADFGNMLGVLGLKSIFDVDC